MEFGWVAEYWSGLFGVKRRPSSDGRRFFVRFAMTRLAGLDPKLISVACILQMFGSGAVGAVCAQDR